MKKFIILIIILLSILHLSCGDKCYYIQSPTQDQDSIQNKDSIGCQVIVQYSYVIRESTFKGFRDGIDFGIDTFPSGQFNDQIETTRNGCDSLLNFWTSKIGKITRSLRIIFSISW